ncbi:MAG: TIGR03960 family B12-binding radical SAM protein [Candidatus Eisenbacteria bacterium]|nr:TIGR03960 family B12-binding radical SAM protein [Candidatus Eisenbacteria bacterium]
MAELYEKLEREVLPLVSRPARYTGGERNVPQKDREDVELSFLLAFPDVYEIGMSHLGIRVLYDILSRRAEIAVERAFAPWIDMEELLREKNIPLFSVESRTPAGDFDVLGFTLQYELHYPEVLTMLDLAGVPLRAWDRGASDPYVVGGGPCAYNPEPMAPFFDLFVIGDGESAVVQLADILIAARRDGASREETLKRTAGLRGVYVPSLYEVRRGRDGSYAGTAPADRAAPDRVERRVEEALPYGFHPVAPIVPATETTHDRLAVEIMRGCTRGCRFCQAGMVTRPVRECPREDVTRLVREGIAASGYDEVSLVSLSASDYTGLASLVERLNEELFERKVSVSLPSLRADRFGLELADGIGRVRKTGLTFAPEAGTQRLRDVINKNETEGKILETVDTAFSAGWNRVKLYFMIGLPTETDEDLRAIAGLVGRVRETARKHRRGANVNVSVSPFVPKPHTPFQWEAQDPEEETRRKERLLRPLLSMKGVKASLRAPEVSLVEGLLARGGRELADVVEAAWRSGARFGGWTETFDGGVWKKALAEQGLGLGDYLGARAPERPLPWEHIDAGLSRSFLLAERERALVGSATPDCRVTGCYDCGACEPGSLVSVSLPPPRPVGGRSAGAFGRRRKRRAAQNGATPKRWRVRYAKRQQARFLSHLDVTRAWTRAVASSGLPVVYTQGFNPRPKLSFGPPLPVGATGEAEFVELELFRPAESGQIVRDLGAGLPPGVSPVSATPQKTRKSASAEACAAEYVIGNLAPLVELDRREIERRIGELLATRAVEVRRGEKTKELRPSERIRSLEIERTDPLELRAVLELGREGSLRPVDVVGLLVGGDEWHARLARVHRLSLFRCPSGGGLESIE